MTERELPYTKMTITRRVEKDEKVLLDEVLEEIEVPMSQQDQDLYHGLIGDANSKLSVGREVSNMNYGTGYKVFVSMSLTHNQDEQTALYAAQLAARLVNYTLEQQFNEFRPIAMKLITGQP